MKKQMRRSRLTPGDILEIEAPQGKIYVHYLGCHQFYGDAVAVIPTFFTERPDFARTRLEGEYVMFYAASAAVAQREAIVVGSAPARPIPTRIRRRGMMDGDRVVTWIVEDESSERVTEQLTESERELPIGSIWSHELLIERVSDGWRPIDVERTPANRSVPIERLASEQRRRVFRSVEEMDEVAVGEIARLSGGITTHRVCHYLYFPTETAARNAASALVRAGFSAEPEPSSYDDNWLVRASSESLVDEDRIALLCQQMSQVAAQFGGEYDGWEAEV